MSEQPGLETTGSRASGGLLWLLLLALPVFLLFLGANTIWEANEAYYVETPRQMVISGDYVTPMFNGEPRVNKPVLSYWVVAGLYNVFGISVTVQRVGIALGALGIIGLTFAIGRAIGTPATGVLAALIVATAPRVVMHARRIFIDVYIALFMAAALAAFVLAERHPEHRRRYLLLMYVAIGLGVLTKGPVAIVLPAAVLLAWLALERRLGDLRRMLLIPGTLIVLAIVAPWYLALYQVHGLGPIESFVFGENVGRFLQPMASAERGFEYYLPVLLGELFPWAPLVLLPLATAWRRTASDATGGVAALRRLLWCWIVVIVAAFSLSRTKLDLYIFPVMPAVAVLIADLLRRTGAGASHRGVRIGLAALYLLTAGLGAAVLWLFRGGYYDLAGTPLAGGLLIGAGLAALLLHTQRRREESVAILAGAFVLFNYLLAGWILPGAERLKPVPAFVGAFERGHAPDAKVGAYGQVMPSLVYYLDRPIERVGSLDQAEAFFRAGPEAWITIRAPELPALQARVRGLCEAARHPAFEARAGDLIRGAPPEEIVLVTSRCRQQPTGARLP